MIPRKIGVYEKSKKNEFEILTKQKKMDSEIYVSRFFHCRLRSKAFFSLLT